jgi:hypothetical protein
MGMIESAEKNQLREKDLYLAGCGNSPSHKYPSSLLAGGIFRVLMIGLPKR